MGWCPPELLQEYEHTEIKVLTCSHLPFYRHLPGVYVPHRVQSSGISTIQFQP